METVSAEAPVYLLPVDMDPAVPVPSIYLKSGCQSVVSLTGRRTGAYGEPLRAVGVKEKAFIVVLSVVLTTLGSLIASLAIIMCQPRGSFEDSAMAYHPTEQIKDLQVTAFHSSGVHDMKNPASGVKLSDTKAAGREPCVGECWSYSAFRFRSKCISGHCICRGNFYDESSCLPSVYGCNMKRNITTSAAYFADQTQTVYSCSTQSARNQKRTFVLSTYGHHNSRETTVDITATSAWRNQSVTLILANYFPTKWRLKLQDGVQLGKIVLISNDHVTESSVDFADASINPPVRKTSYPVGYGDDRNGGHTVGLLKYVRRQFGPVFTFQGSHYADKWHFVLTETQPHTSGANYSEFVHV